jgi:hypothetical protein
MWPCSELAILAFITQCQIAHHDHTQQLQHRKHGSNQPSRQLRTARNKPIAVLIGATAGLVPVGVYEVGHYELTS